MAVIEFDYQGLGLESTCLLYHKITHKIAVNKIYLGEMQEEVSNKSYQHESIDLPSRGIKGL